MTKEEIRQYIFEKASNSLLLEDGMCGKGYLVQQHIDELTSMLDMLQNHKIEHYLEIGVDTLGLTRIINEILKVESIYTMDINPYVHKENAETLVENAQLNMYVGDTKSEHAPKWLKDQKVKFDFVFIDGDHTYEGVKNDFELCLPHLAANAIVGFHDIKSSEGVKKFYEELKKDSRIKFKEEYTQGRTGIGIFVNEDKITLIKREFPKQFQDYYKEFGYPEEGRVVHSKYGGNPTHCRSTMYTLTKILRPRHVLEIGSWKYESSNMIAKAMDDCGIVAGYIDSFDITPGGYDGGYIAPRSNRVIPHYWMPHHTNYDEWKYNDMSNVIHKDFRGRSNQEIFDENLRQVMKIAPKNGYDMILIDGDHSYDGVRIDWAYACTFLTPKGVIIIDDLYDDRHWQVRKFFDELTCDKYDFSDWNEKYPELLISDGVCQID